MELMAPYKHALQEILKGSLKKERMKWNPIVPVPIILHAV